MSDLSQAVSRPYSVTLTVRTTITAASMREAFETVHGKLPLEFELRRFDVEGVD